MQPRKGGVLEVIRRSGAAPRRLGCTRHSRGCRQLAIRPLRNNGYVRAGYKVSSAYGDISLSHSLLSVRLAERERESRAYQRGVAAKEGFNDSRRGASIYDP